METLGEETLDKKNSLENPNSTVEDEQSTPEKEELTAEVLAAKEEEIGATINKKVEDFQAAALAEGGEELPQKIIEELDTLLENKKTELVNTFGEGSSDQVEEMIAGIKESSQEKVRQFSRDAASMRNTEEMLTVQEKMKGDAHEDGKADRATREGLQSEQRISLLEKNDIETEGLSATEIEEKARELSIEIRNLRQKMTDRGVDEMSYHAEVMEDPEGELSGLKKKEEETRR